VSRLTAKQELAHYRTRRRTQDRRETELLKELGEIATRAQAEKPRMPVTEIARRAGVHRATVHRALKRVV
jgi:hypothetical protein